MNCNKLTNYNDLGNQYINNFIIYLHIMYILNYIIICLLLIFNIFLILLQIS
jgi:hypothetical protein